MTNDYKLREELKKANMSLLLCLFNDLVPGTSLRALVAAEIDRRQVRGEAKG